MHAFIEKWGNTELRNMKNKTHERQRKEKKRYHVNVVANCSRYTYLCRKLQFHCAIRILKCSDISRADLYPAWWKL